MKRLLYLAVLFSSMASANQIPLSQTAATELHSAQVLQLQMPEPVTKKAQQAKTLPFIQPQPLQIARASLINDELSSLAKWHTINNQSYLRLTINAPDAEHLNLGFTKVSLPESATLYILDAQTHQLLHSFTANDIHNQSIWTPIVQNQHLTLEVNVLSSEQQQVKLQLQQVGQGIVSFNKNSLTKSGSCNIDTVCTEGDGWRDIIRSVAKYSITTTEGTFVCTGTLLNNDNQDQRPLFLSAAHCFVSETTVDSMVFYWNFETTVCNGIADGDQTQTQTGAKFLSRADDLTNLSDYSLIELSQRPANNHQVYYSAWNAQPGPATDVVTIHHPAGDEKRISLDHDPLTITDYTNPDENLDGHYYRIDAWDTGTTEGGSSGAGLWSQSKELIGTLSGGTASCTDPTNPDWYGRMSSHWQFPNHDGVQIETYLAPNTQQLSESGFEPCDAPTLALSTSTATPQINEQFSFMAQTTGGTAPYQYNWDFDQDGNVDSTDEDPTHTYSTTGLQKAALTVIDANQCRSSARIEVTVPNSGELFISAGQLPTNYTKPTDAAGSWIATTNTASEGDFSLRSQITYGSSTSSIETTETFAAGTLSFDYRVSSEVGFDFFKFYIDGVEQLSADGEVDWTTTTHALSAGSHTLRFSYIKDESLSSGSDTAWIDNLIYTETPAPPTPTPTPTPTPSGGGGSPSIFMLGLLLVAYRVRKIA